MIQCEAISLDWLKVRSGINLESKVLLVASPFCCLKSFRIIRKYFPERKNYWKKIEAYSKIFKGILF